MLQYIILNFLNYCNHYHFSKRTIEAFTTRLNELERAVGLERNELDLNSCGMLRQLMLVRILIAHVREQINLQKSIC